MQRVPSFPAMYGGILKGHRTGRVFVQAPIISHDGGDSILRPGAKSGLRDA